MSHNDAVSHHGKQLQASQVVATPRVQSACPPRAGGLEETLRVNATHLLYQAAGYPAIQNAIEASGQCWLCGNNLAIYEFVVARKDVIKNTFVDHDKCAVPSATHLCAACAWSFSEHVPMAGREKPQRLRNYSHFVVGGKWICLNKGQKREMQFTLLNPPANAEWLGVVAESGQKHIIFRAPTAYGNQSCQIQFEEQRITYAPTKLRLLVAGVEQLMNLSFSKTEIESGQYISHRVVKTGLGRWQELETFLKPHRGSAQFQLAIFVSQKAQGEDDGRTASDGD